MLQYYMLRKLHPSPTSRCTLPSCLRFSVAALCSALPHLEDARARPATGTYFRLALADLALSHITYLALSM